MKRRLNLITLILLLMCIIIMPVLIQGYMLGKGAVNQVESLYDKSVSNNMESLSISLDFYVNHIEDYIRTLSQDQDLQKLLNDNENAINKQRAIRDRLNAFTAAYRLRVPLYVQVMNNQEEVFSSNLLHDTETERLKQVIRSFHWPEDRIPYDNNIMYRNVGDDFHDLSSGQSDIYFSKNIVQGNTALGLLNVEVNDTLFQRLLRKIQLNSSTLALISQDNGEVLISSEDKNASLQALSRNAIAKAKLSGEEYESFRIQWNGQSYFCSIQNIPFLKWYLIALTPEDLLASPTKRLWNHTLTVTVSSILLISLILYIFTRKAMLPILQLSKTVRKIRFNDAGQNVNWHFPYKGLEEIEILYSGIQQMVSRINEQFAQIKADEREKSHLELNLLLSQIKPHFLHNSINSIRWMAEMKGEKTIAQTLVNLSSMLNYTLSKSLTIWSTIGEELDYVSSYIAFQEKRLLMKIELQLEMPQEMEIRQARILKLTLQPIVENAILHGFADLDGITPQLTLSCVLLEGERVRVEVRDNGAGMEEAVVAGMLLGDSNATEDEGRTSGIGLKNVHRRLQLEYGNRYGIDIRSKKGEGTAVALTFPYQNDNGGLPE